MLPPWPGQMLPHLPRAQLGVGRTGGCPCPLGGVHALWGVPMPSGRGEQVLGVHWPCVVPPISLSRPEPCPQGVVCLQIREEIDHYGIRIYQFPECDSDEDEEFKLQDQALKVGLAPLAPSLEGQSPVARRTRHPGVAAGLFEAMQALQRGGAGTYLTTQTHHQYPMGDTRSLVGWGWVEKPMT